eukprot:scaffold6849_cov60-Phaeocystis_antarctica.AAC.2
MAFGSQKPPFFFAARASRRPISKIRGFSYSLEKKCDVKAVFAEVTRLYSPHIQCVSDRTLIERHAPRTTVDSRRHPGASSAVALAPWSPFGFALVTRCTAARTHTALTHPALTHPALTHPALTHPALTRPAFPRPALTHLALTHRPEFVTRCRPIS